MKAIITLLCLVAVSYAQGQLTRLDPDTNEDSMCGDARMCPNGTRCIERRNSEDSVINECIARLTDGENCTRRDFFTGGAEEGDELVDDERFTPVRFNRERAVGASDRDFARRIHGSMESRQCEDGLTCMENTCTMREATMCDLQARSNDQVRCEGDGRFQILQCRRPQGLAARSCFCVNQTNGDMIAGTMRTVMSREDLPDCTATLSCTFQRALRTALLRDGEASARVENGRCLTCECEGGQFMCRIPAGDNPDCPRYDAEDTPRVCMMDGEEVPHGQRQEDGKCNMCGCRNGFMRCTRVRDCRGEDNDAGGDGDRDSEDRRCDECMDMPNGPVCAVRDGRTFPTRCHAMRCQGFEMDELRDGPCSERNACSGEQPCGENSVCMRRGGSTLMSREASLPNDRRICVNRQELRCRPAIIMSDGRRRIMDDGEDSAEVGEDAGDNDEDDETVCASDGNTYPSTCHMIAESRGDMVPRVMHPGMCRPMRQADQERSMVCATDGVAYADERTMRTTGGNVRMDYMGRCDNPDSDEDDTPAQRCMRARESKCPSLEGCTKRVQPADGCCPVCGGIVVMAMDQEALDQHTRTTRDLREVDEYMGRFFQPGDRDAAVSNMAPRRCNISMTLPTRTAGNDVEVLFQARDTRSDGDYCLEQAMLMVTNLNMVADPGTVVSNEETFVAAIIVAPEAVVDSVPAFAASCAMLLGALLVAFLL